MRENRSVFWLVCPSVQWCKCAPVEFVPTWMREMSQKLYFFLLPTPFCRKSIVSEIAFRQQDGKSIRNGWQSESIRKLRLLLLFISHRFMEMSHFFLPFAVVKRAHFPHLKKRARSGVYRGEMANNWGKCKLPKHTIRSRLTELNKRFRCLWSNMLRSR